MTHRITPLSTRPVAARVASVLVLLITTLTAGMGFA